MKRNKRNKSYGDWNPIASAPFQWHGDDDDDSVEWGRLRSDEVKLMAGWDFYYGDPTHWRLRNPSTTAALEALKAMARNPGRVREVT